MPPIQPKPALLDPLALIARFEAAARGAGFRVEPFGEIAVADRDESPAARYSLLALTKRAPGPRPRIYLSAGIHGDEPAPPLALLEMLEAGVFDSRATWFICPMLNPLGFIAGTRENAGGVDLNRDYRHLVSREIRAHVLWLQRQPNFDVAFAIHEDWESKGFYLYELNSGRGPSFAEAMISAASRVCPIETASVIDGREIAAPGIIRPVSDPLRRELWPETIYLRAHHTMLTYTLESPSALPLAQRIATLRAAIEVAIAS